MTERWRLLRSGAVTPVDAMALDEALLTLDGPPTLRLYRWSPHAISLGYFQPFALLDASGVARVGVPVVRRLTGGGAIFHGDEVTFSLTAPVAHSLFACPVRASYDRVHDVLARAIERCCATTVAPRGGAALASDRPGSLWCFHGSTPFDLAAHARKLVGSAQRRTGGRVLHHGSIVLRANRFTPEVASLESLGGDPSADRLEAALAEAFASGFGVDLVDAQPTAAESARARDLASARYGSDAWTKRR